MMKILMVSPECPPIGSGIGNVVLTLKEHLESAGVRVDIISRGTERPRRSLGVSLPGVFGLLPFWEHTSKLIEARSSSYDLVWLHAPLLLHRPDLSPKTRLMVSFHSTYSGFYRAFKSHGLVTLLPYYRLACSLERHFLEQLNRVDNLALTAVTPSVADELRSNGLRVPVHVVPNGLSDLAEKPRRRAVAREGLLEVCNATQSKGEKILVYVGRITEVKQIGLMLRFFKTVWQASPRTHLVIIGSGNLLPKVKRMSAQLPTIHAIGRYPHDRVLEFLAGADAFISLSCYEGLPLAVLEAASLGLPLVLSDIAAHKQICSAVRNQSVLVNSRSPNTAHVVDFLDNLQTSGPDIRESPREYSWSAVVQEYLDLASPGSIASRMANG